MAIRRVFRTRAKCPGIRTDLGPTANQHRMIGRMVTFEKLSSSEVNIIMDGAVVGQLDAAVGNPVALALERGQSFTAAIEKAFPMLQRQLQANRRIHRHQGGVSAREGSASY